MYTFIYKYNDTCLHKRVTIALSDAQREHWSKSTNTDSLYWYKSTNNACTSVSQLRSEMRNESSNASSELLLPPPQRVTPPHRAAHAPLPQASVLDAFVSICTFVPVKQVLLYQ